jgi:hypothetical protein
MGLRFLHQQTVRIKMDIDGKRRSNEVTEDLRIIANITNLVVFCNGYKYIAFKVAKYLTHLLVNSLLSC